jgi:hypothetical protein
MTYQLTHQGNITLPLEDGCLMFLPPEDNGTPEWAAYKAWLSEGNTPLPTPEPEPAPVLTTEQKLEAAGLTVAELKELFGLQ